MNLYMTEIKAICPHTNKLRVFKGPIVPGESLKDAQDFCDTYGISYCKVVKLLISKVPYGEEYDPNWRRGIGYYQQNN